jgi:hypothetical protein
MASTITAGNATNGITIKPDSTGILELKTGTGAGTTAVSIDASQIVTGTAGNLMLVSGTAVTASGSSVDFTGIPSWVKRITVAIAGLSFAAAGVARLRIGDSGGLVASGYTGGVTSLTTGANTFAGLSDGIAALATGAAGSILNGQYVLVNVSGNIWQCNGFHYRNTDVVTNLNSGFITLTGTLDRLSIVATTSTFDAGTVNIIYE